MKSPTRSRLVTCQSHDPSHHIYCQACNLTLPQVRSQVPWLANVLRLLQETLELAQDLIDKVQYIIATSYPGLPSRLFFLHKCCEGGLGTRG